MESLKKFVLFKSKKSTIKMKQIIIIILAVLFISLQYGYSQNQEIPEGAIMIDENTIIKDESGNKIEGFKLMELMNSGEWTVFPVNDSMGNLKYLQLRKATEKEKMKMAEMSMHRSSSDLIGKNAPDFKVEDINGNNISLEDAKGKVIVLNFWFTSCKPCIDEIPELNKVYEEYKTDTNVVFASITFNKLDEVNAFLKNHPIKYPVVTNAKETCNLFNVSGYPTNIIIDKNGTYFDFIRGGNPKIGHHISNSIQNALQGNKPVSSSAPSGGMVLDPNSTFKLENGDIIPFKKAIDLLNSNEYDIEPQKDKNKYYLLKKKN